MAAFTKPAVDSPFSKLPAELATRILDFRFAGRSPDVAPCRLVCQDLYILSSPYLIRTVVVAERLPALRKLREVMQHPYFGKYATHIIWDASYYDSRIATDYHLYEDAHERSEHLATSRDEAYIKARQSDALLFEHSKFVYLGSPGSRPLSAVLVICWSTASDRRRRTNTVCP